MIRDVLLFLITFFIVLNCLGFLFYSGGYDTLAFNHIKGVLSCFLPFFMGIYFTIKGKLNPIIFEYLFYLLALVTFFTFFRVQNTLLSDSVSGNVVNNIAYSFARLIPLLYFVRKNMVFRLGLLLLIVFFVISGAKRGALVIGLIGTIMYLLFLFKNKELKRGCLGGFVSFLVIVAFGYLLVENILGNEFLMNRFNSGNLSGRDDIYSTLFDSWYASNNWNLLFGLGFVSSLDLTGFLAHNDWLEILSSFGLLGVFVYLGILVCLIKLSFSQVMTLKERFLLMTIVSMWCVTTVFSTWFNSIDTFCVMLILGYLYGVYMTRKRI